MPHWLRTVVFCVFALEPLFTQVSGAHIAAEQRERMFGTPQASLGNLQQDMSSQITVEDLIRNMGLWDHVVGNLTARGAEKLKIKLPDVRDINMTAILSEHNNSPNVWPFAVLSQLIDRLPNAHTVHRVFAQSATPGALDIAKSRFPEERLMWEMLRQIEDLDQLPNIDTLTNGSDTQALDHLQREVDALEQIVGNVLRFATQPTEWSIDRLKRTAAEAVQSIQSLQWNSSKVVEHIRDDSYVGHVGLAPPSLSVVARVMKLASALPSTASRLRQIHDFEQSVLAGQPGAEGVSFLEIDFDTTLSMIARVVRVVLLICSAGLIIGAVVYKTLISHQFTFLTSENFVSGRSQIIMLVMGAVCSLATIIWLAISASMMKPNPKVLKALSEVTRLVIEANEERVRDLSTSDSSSRDLEATHRQTNTSENAAKTPESAAKTPENAAKESEKKESSRSSGDESSDESDTEAEELIVSHASNSSDSNTPKEGARTLKKTPQYFKELNVFNQIFDGQLENGGISPRTLYAFLVHHMIPQKLARAVVNELNAHHRHHITFDDIYQKILHPSDDTNYLSMMEANFEEDRQMMMASILALLMLGLDGGWGAQLIMFIVIGIFIIGIGISVNIITSFNNLSHKSASIRAERDSGFYRTLLKIIAASIAVFSFVGLFTLFSSCQPSIPSCQAGNVVCTQTRSYLPSDMQCTSNALSCTPSMTWQPPTGPASPTAQQSSNMMLYLSNLDSSISLAWNLGRAMTFAAQQQIMQVAAICVDSLTTQPSNAPCVVLAASGVQVVIQDTGSAPIQSQVGMANAGLEPKQVFFVPWGQQCSSQTEPQYQTVQSFAASTSTFENWFPAQGLSSGGSVYMMNVQTPSTTSDQYFRMCQKSVSQNAYTSATCAYQIAPAAVCGSPNCNIADFDSVYSGSIIDRFYYTSIVHATVGFGDVVLTSVRGRSMTFLEALLIIAVTAI